MGTVNTYRLYTKSTVLSSTKSGLVVPYLKPINSLYTAPKNSLPLGHSSFLPVRTFEARYDVFIFCFSRFRHGSRIMTIPDWTFPSGFDHFVWCWFCNLTLPITYGKASYPLYAKITHYPSPKSGLVVSVLEPMNSLQSAPKILHPLGHSSFLPVHTFETTYSIFIFALHNSKMVPILR